MVQPIIFLQCINYMLCTADIVSHWTWAATLLQSSNQAYQYGVSGPFWYAGGATIQIILFGILAVQVKMKAPSAHTVLEIVHARWGTAAHLVFFFFCFLTNIIVSAMLILGGAAVMTALTGMNTIAVRALKPYINVPAICTTSCSFASPCCVKHAKRRGGFGIWSPARCLQACYL